MPRETDVAKLIIQSEKRIVSLLKSSIAESERKTGERFDKLDRKFDLKFDLLNREMGTVKGDIAGLKNDVKGLKEDVADLKSSQQSMALTLDDMDTYMRSEFTSLNRRTTRLERAQGIAA